MQLCIFEDDRFRDLEPLSLYRPTYELVCGKNTHREKILRVYPSINYSLHCRTYLAPLQEILNPGIEINKISDDECLFINGSIIASKDLSSLIPLNGSDKIYLNDDRIIAAHVSGKNLKELKKRLNEPLDVNLLSGLPVEKVEVKIARYIWDLINHNGSELVSDFDFYASLKKERIAGKVYNGANLVEKENIIIEEGAQIKPGAVIDASDGPVFIGKNAVIFPNSVIEGPAYIGESTLIKSCATIYKNVSIGKVCKVGGEVEDMVFLPYSNKQHSGYLGHSYIGSWVNIGADTNCSDLKNNYSSIKVKLNGTTVDTGLQFLGLIIGDHSKTAINTMFNTGTIAGFSCNIFGEGFPPKYIPAFSWGGSSGMLTYEVEKGIVTAKKVMERRLKKMSEAEENVFRFIFNFTERERTKKEFSS